MKSFILISLIALLFTSETFARETPAAFFCRSVGGVAWTLDVGQVDDLQLCLLDSAQIAAESLRRAVYDRAWDGAIQAYYNSPMSCANAGGTERDRRDTNGNSFQTCEFSDGSAIGVKTLELGKSAPQNSRLSNVLGF